MNALNNLGNLDEHNLDHDREREHCEAIDKEKKRYAECFQQLRDLKASIEHIQRLIEKRRNKLQSDFEKWYDQHNDKGGRNTTNEPSPFMPATSATKINVKINENNEAREESSENQAQKNESTQNEKQFTLPPGIRLTGNKEADDDIIAFYKAKEELLARRKKSNG